MIATTSVDGTTWLWETDGPFIAALEGHRSWVNTGRFSPDGLRLVTTSWDGTARQWGVYGNAEAMLAEALSRLNRQLTDFECQEYLHLENCP
jgi:WD40 repeat protein